METLVRRATEGDIPRVKELLSDVLDIHHSIRPDVFKPDCRKYTDPELSEIISDSKRPIFVADIDGDVVGYAFCIIKEIKDDNILLDAKTLYIDDLCIDSAMRSQGIGERIYLFVKSYAREIGCTNITLNVWEGNDSAKAFYHKMGLSPRRTEMEEIL